MPEEDIDPELEFHEGKRVLRSDMRSKRRNAEPEWIKKASARIQQTVISLPEFHEASAVGAYLALPFEVQTRTIIETSWFGNKRVCVPGWNTEENRYELIWFGREDPTIGGQWNVLEPKTRQRAGLMDVDILVVPALAFDRQGGRLGHGGGHYDRMLGAWSGLKVGIAFEFQIFDEVPMGSQDTPVDLIVTEQHTYRAKSGA